MKRGIIVIVLLAMSIVNAYSQHALLEIKELKVANVVVNLEDDIFDEDESDGPYVNLSCELINTGSDDFYIYPSISDIFITFNYKGTEYKIDVEAMPFTDEEIRDVKCGQAVNFRVGAYLLLGTSLWSESKSDYRDVLLCILPTIRVRYLDTNIGCYSSVIKTVKTL
ncbi:MAG: hypothetical protein ACK5IJ_10125 [Mangrovibacterium sp.]